MSNSIQKLIYKFIKIKEDSDYFFIRNFAELEQFVVNEQQDLVTPITIISECSISQSNQLDKYFLEFIRRVDTGFLSRLFFKKKSLCFSRLRNKKANSTPSLSIIIPCKNEAQNLKGCMEVFPNFDCKTEIIICDDHSTDDSMEIAKKLKPRFDNQEIIVLTGPNQGKAKNVWTGFQAASGDILIILDADFTVPSYELPKFYQLLADQKTDFINGSRLTKNLSPSVMPTFNQIGNRFFAIVFSVLLKQRFTDVLCGTKALWRDDFQKMFPTFDRWWAHDKWGDFELILGSYCHGLKITEIPVDYLAREHGESKMNQRLINAARMGLILFSAFVSLNLL